MIVFDGSFVARLLVLEDKRVVEGVESEEVEKLEEKR